MLGVDGEWFAVLPVVDLLCGGEGVGLVGPGGSVGEVDAPVVGGVGVCEVVGGGDDAAGVVVVGGECVPGAGVVGLYGGV